MTNIETDAELRFDPPGPGPWGLDPVHFPRPVTRYWAETHPEAFIRGTSDFARFYGMLIDGMQTAYVNGFAYNTMKPAPEEEIPQRFQRAEEVFDKQALAGAAARVGRHRQAGCHRRPSGDPGHRSRRSVGKGDDRLSDPMPRPPLGHDLPTHAVSRRRP